MAALLRSAAQAAPDVDVPEEGVLLAGFDASEDDAFAPVSFEAFALPELPASDEAAGASEEPFSDLAGAAASLALPPLLPPRKSVTYQPEPFNWNPAAVTCFENVACPQAGHCVSGASLIF